jgi:hypothetical protein
MLVCSREQNPATSKQLANCYRLKLSRATIEPRPSTAICVTPVSIVCAPFAVCAGPMRATNGKSEHATLPIRAPLVSLHEPQSRGPFSRCESSLPTHFKSFEVRRHLPLAGPRLKRLRFSRVRKPWQPKPTESQPILNVVRDLIIAPRQLFFTRVVAD